MTSSHALYLTVSGISVIRSIEKYIMLLWREKKAMESLWLIVTDDCNFSKNQAVGMIFAKVETIIEIDKYKVL